MPAESRAEPAPQSIEEMMRIMDVATTLRQERETVLQEFNREQTRQHLRERLLAAAELTGEIITPQEVDAAIDHYYESLHEFREPRRSLSVFLAHAYVRRALITKVCLAVAAVALAAWLLFFAPFAPLSATAQLRRRLQAADAAIAAYRTAIDTIAEDNAASDELAALVRQAEAFRKNEDLAGLQDVQQRLEAMGTRLREAYTVQVVSGPDEQSGTERLFTDDDGQRVSGHYLIVEARNEDGRVVRLKIRNQETGRAKEVTRWAERVPRTVFERLQRDKKEDGILNETLFSEKREGYRDEEVKILADDGQPISRDGQITEW